jgi:quinol-cytochrome oxidoreductase complex cytochrome b subunit
MVGLTLLHLSFLHIDGSTNPLGLDDSHDFIPFYPYFLIKDIFGFLVFLWVFSYLIFFEPNILGHPDNYIRANPLVTPAHIVPEWYFLPFYAILRAVPSKLGGVAAMGAAVCVLFLLPRLDRRSFSLLRKLGDFMSEAGYFLKRSCIIYWYGFPEEFVKVLRPAESKILWVPEEKVFRPRKASAKKAEKLFVWDYTDHVENEFRI